MAIGALCAFGDKRLSDSTLAKAVLQFHAKHNAAPCAPTHEEMSAWAAKHGEGARRLASRLKSCMNHSPDKSKSDKLAQCKAMLVCRLEELGLIQPLEEPEQLSEHPQPKCEVSAPSGTEAEGFDWDTLSAALPATSSTATPASESTDKAGPLDQACCSFSFLQVLAFLTSWLTECEQASDSSAQVALKRQQSAASSCYDTPQKPSGPNLHTARLQFVKDRRAAGSTWQAANTAWMLSAERCSLLGDLSFQELKRRKMA